MKHSDRLFITNYINYNYQNNILPQIPKILTTYLLKNEDKQKYYINNKTNINDLLYKISLKYKKNQDLDLLKTIIEIQEDK